MLKTIRLLGVNVSRVNLASAAAQIEEWVHEKKSTYVCVAPVSTLVDARRDPRYRDVINAAGMVTPDGMPVVWLARARGGKEVSRTYGPDLLCHLCRRGQSIGLKHFFYGGTQDSVARLKQKLREAYPLVKIVGSHVPPFRQGIWQEDQAVLDIINKTEADIVWVGLGSPKQDFWMDRHRALLKAPVIIGAGAAFDFCAGTKPQAPRWIQPLGLEWLFRLCCEP
ncbi:MAG: WecB/TagA/CpsF family glycosyltransferase, partial [Candidatus Omnitrophica bacterium]|nr:WecB/TagA/CpsF family glycosyltransferase [Candidatus Omnitrophota bacterium]